MGGGAAPGKRRRWHLRTVRVGRGVGHLGVRVTSGGRQRHMGKQCMNVESVSCGMECHPEVPPDKRKVRRGPGVPTSFHPIERVVVRCALVFCELVLVWETRLRR